MMRSACAHHVPGRPCPLSPRIVLASCSLICSSIWPAVRSVSSVGIDLHAELGQDVGLQAGQIVLVRTRRFRAATVDEAADDAARRFQNALLLIRAFQQRAAHAVNRLALLVHHVVVFQKVFARFEILRFHGLLRRGDALGDQLRFDRHVFFHAEAQHQILHALAAEDAHQIVLQRKIEARAAGVALAAGASAKLVVDAAGFVPLGAHNMQAAQRRPLRRVRFDLLP